MNTKNSVDRIIKKYASNTEEKEELWKIIEEIVHHRIVGCVLDNLDRKHHEEFLQKINDSKSFDEDLMSYIKSRSSKDIEKEIQRELEIVEIEILQDVNPFEKKKK